MSPSETPPSPESDLAPKTGASRASTPEEALPTVFMSPVDASGSQVRDESSEKTLIEPVPSFGSLKDSTAPGATQPVPKGSVHERRPTRELDPEVARALEDPSRAIGRYAVLGELGRGGMGVVYRAYDTGLRRPVALKMILDPTRAGAEQVARFQVEASAAGRLRHPGIVSVYEVGEHEGKPYLVMELIDGQSFEALLKSGPVPTKRVAEVVRDVALALDHAHQAGIVHRDVKPENVLIDRAEGKPHLMDFGLAREAQTAERLTVTGAVLGTPAYMSPEQAAGDPKAQGPHSDVFALGAVLYRSLAGHPPFRGETLNKLLSQIISEEATPLRATVKDVPPDIETITLRCLEKEPERRYPSAGAVADELARFVRGEPILARPVGALERTGLWIRRNRKLALWIFLALAVIGGLGTAAVVFFMKDKKEEKKERALEEQTKRLEEQVKQSEAAARDRKAAQEKFREGEIKRKASDWDGAIAEYDRAIELDSQSQQSVLMRGFCKLQKQDYESARKDFDRAIELDPLSPHAWKDRGDARQHLNDPEGALADYSKAVELDPKYAPAYHERALLHRTRHEFDLALADFAKAAELDPKNALFIMGRGIAKARHQDDAGAIADFTKVIELDPRNAEAYHHRGVSLAKKNDLDHAIADFSKALELKPGLAVALKERGTAHEKKKDSKAAIADLEAYLKAAPRAPDAAEVRAEVERLKKPH